MTKPVPAKDEETGRFLSGNIGGGRSKGSRNKLGEAFLADMLTDWEAHGAAAIVKVRDEKPDQYLKVVASILPKELNLRVNEFDDLSDDQLARQLASIASQLARAGVDLGAGAGPTEASEQAGELPTVQ